MRKDFDDWNTQKKALNDQVYAPLYHTGEVRWCRLGTNIGFEQDGTGEDRSRPVLILKGFSREVCLVVPLTTSQKKNPYYVPVGMIGDRQASAIVSQLRLIDTKRLDQLIAFPDRATFEKIRKAVKDML